MFTFMEFRISYVFLMLMAFIFLRRKYSDVVTLTIAVFSYLIVAGLDYWYMFIVPEYEALAVLVEILVTQSAIMLMSEYRDFRDLFIGISASAYVMYGNIFCSVTYAHLHIEAVAFAVQIAAHCLILLLIFQRIKTFLNEELQFSHRHWLHLCLIPATFYLCQYFLSGSSSDAYLDLRVVCLSFLLLVLMLLVYYVIFLLLTQQRKESQLKSNNELLEGYTRQLRKEYEITCENEQKMAVIRHDFRHYIRVFNAYLENGQYERLSDEFKKMDHELETTRSVHYCKNAAIDGVMAYYLSRAEKMKTDIQYKLDIPEKIGIDDFELATVISNILENALQAVTEYKAAGGENEKLIVHAGMVRQNLVMEIQNSCIDSEVQFDHKFNLMTTHGEGHGYGMRSVMGFVEKYHATFDYHIQNNLFKARMVVPVLLKEE